MLNNIKTNVILPLLGRLGTATATVLIGYGMNGDTAHQAGIAVSAIGLVVADLFIEWLNRRNAK